MKRWSVLTIIVILLFLQVFSAGAVLGAAATDILITGYTTNPAQIYEGQQFTLTMTCKNNTGAEIDAVYVIVGDSSAFYGVSTNTIALTLAPVASGNTFSAPLSLMYKGAGNQLNVTFKYHHSGDPAGAYTESDQSLFVRNVNPTDNTPSQPVDTSKYIPKLNISNTATVPVLAAGRQAVLTYPIKNSGSYAARTVVISLEPEDKTKAPFLFDKLSLTQTIDTINPNETKNAVFDFTVLSTAPEGIYTMKLSYSFQNPFGDNFSSTGTAYIKIQNDNSTPRLSVESVTTNPFPVGPGEKLDVAVNLRNMGSLAAKGVKVTLKGLKSDGFITNNSTDVKYLGTIGGGSGSMASYSLLASSGISGGTHELMVKLEYKDEMGNSYTEENQIFLTVRRTGTGKGLSIGNIQYPQNSIAPNKDFKIAFDLVNSGNDTIDNIKVSLTYDKAIVSKSLSTLMIDSLEKGQSRNLEFIMVATGEALTGNYPIAINVEYEDTRGSTPVKTTISQYVGVFVENGGGKSVPRIIIDKYSFDPGDVKAGAEFTLNMSFLNTNRAEVVSNIKVTVVSDDGTFTPVNSGNTFFIEKIGSKRNAERSILFRAKPDADNKPYIVSVNFEYEDSKGNPYSTKETISVPVQQNPRLVTGQLNLPPEAMVGQPVPVFVDFYNMGKVTLYNLMVKAEGDFQAQNASYYVGNFEPGRSDSFEAQIVPNAAGSLKGNVVFAFEDASGKQIEIKKEFTLNVMEMQQQPMPGEEMPGMGPDGKPIGRPGAAKGFNPLYVIIPGAVLAVGAAMFIILRRKHIRRKEMSLDE